jgi:hypothetical protein
LAWVEVLEIMKRRCRQRNLRCGKATANKPKPKPIKIDDFDEDLDGKYYIKTNWINQLKHPL